MYSNVFTHPNLGKIGVVVLDRLNCLKYDKENYKKEVYIPAIIGDAKNNTTLNLALIDKAKMVLSLVAAEEATLHLFNVIREKQEERKGVIAVPATSQQRLLIPQSCDTNIDFLHGYRIRGWELGDIVAGNLISRIKKNSKFEDVKILILGCGKQLHFLLEKIWLEIVCEKGRNMTEDEGKFFKEFLRNNCLIIGNDDYINNSTITIGDHTYWNHELAYVTNSAIYEREKYKMLVPYLRGISDEPTLLEPIVSGELLTNKEKQKEKQKQEPFKSINPKFFEKKPEIIIVSSNSHEEILKVFNELNSIVKKYNLAPKPVIVAESNPDIQKTVMELNKAHMWVETSEQFKFGNLPSNEIDAARNIIQDTLMRSKLTSKIHMSYDECKRVCVLFFKGVMSIKERDILKRASDHSGYQTAIDNLFIKSFPSTKYPISFLNEPYPIEFSENIVNPFKDGVKMVRGYMEAMTDYMEKEKKQVQNGVVLRACVEDKPGVFSKLAFLLASLEVIQNKDIIDKEVTYVPSFHNTQCLSQRNNYFCFYTDADLSKREEVACIKNKEGSPTANHIREVFVSSNNPDNKKALINGGLIPKASKKICGPCMGLTYCSIASLERSIATEFNPTSKEDKENSRWKNDISHETHHIEIGKNSRYENFARIYACCKGGDESKALAMLLYKFMLYNSNVYSDGTIKVSDYLSCKTNQVLNLKYVMNVECYNPGFELLKMYGNLGNRGQTTGLDTLYQDCLQGIVISPVRKEKEWKDYSDRLMKKMHSPLLYYDGKNKNAPDNILLITEKYRDLLLKEYIQFEIEKIVDELKNRGDIKSESSTDADKRKFKLWEEFKFKKIAENQLKRVKPFINEINEIIEGYLTKKVTQGKWGDWIGDLENFDEFKEPEKNLACPCPITDCPFKSKALYLLVEGERFEGKKE